MTRREEKEHELKTKKEKIVDRIKKAINELNSDVCCYYIDECDDIEGIRNKVDYSADVLKRLADDFIKIREDLEDLEEEVNEYNDRDDER